jgi:hypothetical protein
MHGKIPAAQPFACQWCGKEYWITKRTGRPSKFCSDQCRNRDFRCSEKAPPSDPTGCNETPPKNTATAKACKRGFSDRPTVDKALWRRIVGAERGWSGGRETVSSGGVRCFIVREHRVGGKR